MIADYSEGGKVNRITNADNATIIAIYPEQYEQLDRDLYVRLRNTSPVGSHGGAISRITIRYAIDESDAPAINQAPGKNNTSRENIPSKGQNTPNESKYLVSTKDGISTYKRTVATNSSGADLEFLEYNTAGSNAGLRFCDKNGQLVYLFDLSDKLSAVYTFLLSQNYILEASADGENYQIIADYSEGGKVPHLITGGNNIDIQVDMFDYAGESGVVYIRLRNTDSSMGWGGSIHQFVMEYTKAAK
jgi:hypothetical protein